MTVARLLRRDGANATSEAWQSGRKSEKKQGTWESWRACRRKFRAIGSDFDVFCWGGLLEPCRDQPLSGLKPNECCWTVGQVTR